MNLLSFTGRIGADSEIKTTQSGTTICSFPVALESGWGDNKKTSWPRCNIFGKKAEGNLPKYLVKGQEVAITGELSLETWQSKDGENKSALKVAVNTIDLVGNKPERQDNYSQQQPPAPPVPQPGGGSFDDDIPFLYVDARAW